MNFWGGSLTVRFAASELLCAKLFQHAAELLEHR
jgi:hypothetical protein